MASRTIPTVGWALTLISSTAAARCCREPPPRAKGSTIACSSTSLLVRESMVSLAIRRGIVGVPTGVGKPGLPAVTNAGMLSVNAYTGQTWYHSWHSNFVAADGAE